MHIEEDGTHTFSHTSLSLWRLCKRRWWFRYVAGRKEPLSLQALWSIEMVHRPWEIWSGMGEQGLSEAQWADCQERFQIAAKEAGFDTTHDDFHTMGTGKRIFEQVRLKILANGKIQGSESEIWLDLSRLSRYYSRPDLIIERDGRWCFTVDFKYTEKTWQKNGNPWPVRELLPYDDQLLGQAIATGADGFIRVTIRANNKTGEIADVVVQERLVDQALRQEGLVRTKATIREIEGWLTDYNWPHGPREDAKPWPKNDDACFAFGKPCSYLTACKAGWKLLRLET